MKILALDIGDVWIGTAYSDPLGITATPFQTIKAKDLELFIAQQIKEQKINTVVVGYPKTMRGTESEQTKKIVATKEDLEKKFPNIEWIFWDERLTSKQAKHFKKARDQKSKEKSHSIAAAFILSGYLASCNFFS